jgi:2,4-dienoyl-CoA reductase-like NADH-dependent reductase (Old Yellow Enzyme family)
MAEGLAEKKHLPGTRIFSLYGKWAKGGWGALLTGKKIPNGSLRWI